MAVQCDRSCDWCGQYGDAGLGAILRGRPACDRDLGIPFSSRSQDDLKNGTGTKKTGHTRALFFVDQVLLRVLVSYLSFYFAFNDANEIHTSRPPTVY